MGMSDSFYYYESEKKEIQLNSGDCGLYEFNIGDNVSDFGYVDGIHFSHSSRGVVVVYGGIFVAAYGSDSLFDSYGQDLDFYRVNECHD